MRGGVLHQVFLGLGSNLGDRAEYLRRAVELIGERIGKVVRQSSLIETEPWGFQSENNFLNGVILCETGLTPRQVLKATQRIERELGKKRCHATRRSPQSGNRSISSHDSSGDAPPPIYSDRPIDIDILLYDDLTVDEPDLKIPHPQMLQRDFVMRPLEEIKE